MSADDSGEVHFWQIVTPPIRILLCKSFCFFCSFVSFTSVIFLQSKDVTDILDVVPDQDFAFKVSFTDVFFKNLTLTPTYRFLSHSKI
jgi:hypothetical protein